MENLSFQAFIPKAMICIWQFGRSSDSFPKVEPSHRISGLTDSGIFNLLQKLTAAGTVADFHGIPS